MAHCVRCVVSCWCVVCFGAVPMLGFWLVHSSKTDASRPLVMAHRKGPNGMGASP